MEKAPEKIKDPKVTPDVWKDGPPEIKLPFEKTELEPGEWVYDRRIPIFITLIVYLVLAIMFVSSKIVLDRRDTVSAIIVDLDDMEKLKKELEEAQKLNDMLNNENDRYAEHVRNIISSEQGDRTNPDRRMSPSEEEYVKQAEELDRNMQEVRDMYEQGLVDEKQLRNKERNQDNEDVKPVKVDGEVTVSYSFESPPRVAQNLFVPAYKCRRGGRVVVDVVISQRGDVISASVVKGLSVSDRCMTATAIEAAYESRFNVNTNAPSKQEGRIIYSFVSQPGR